MQQFAERDALQVADVASVLMIELVGELRAGDAHGAGVDHDDVIAEVLMRRIIRLVLALQPMRDLRGQTPEGLACGVDQIPVAAGFSGFENTVYMELLRCVGSQRKARKCTEPRGAVTSPAVPRRPLIL